MRIFRVSDGKNRDLKVLQGDRIFTTRLPNSNGMTFYDFLEGVKLAQSKDILFPLLLI